MTNDEPTKVHSLREAVEIALDMLEAITAAGQYAPGVGAIGRTLREGLAIDNGQRKEGPENG